jgi:5-methylcytosine-specific restriction endonuclease McrA
MRDNRVYWSREWKAVRLRVLVRDAWTCKIRGPGCTLVANTVDHVVALSDGGPPYDPRNLRAACAHCNYSRHHPARVRHLLRRRGGFGYRDTTARYDTRSRL